MSLLIVGIICIALSITIVPLALRLPSKKSILVTAAVVTVGFGAVGLFCSFNVRWQPSPTIRYLGFPFPAMLWQLENGKWVDYVGGPITGAMNVIWFAAVGLVPVFAWVVWQRPWRTHKGG